MPPHAALIDLYDTLVDGDWPWWRARLAERLGVGEETVGEAFRRTRPLRNTGAYPDQAGDLAAVIEAVGVRPDPALLAELVLEERAFSVEHIHPFPESMDVVSELRSRGIATALVSNCSHNTVVVVEHLRLAEAFDAVLLSFEVGVAKPEPGIYEAALRAIDARPPETIFVDDQAEYCDGAAILGIEARLILRRGVEPAEGISQVVGHRAIESLSELLDEVTPPRTRTGSP
jgi:putative hydrolase of the HAD superfamily